MITEGVAHRPKYAKYVWRNWPGVVSLFTF